MMYGGPGFGGFGGMGIFMWLVPIFGTLLLIALVVVIVLALRQNSHASAREVERGPGSSTGAAGPTEQKRTPFEILDERYARGEIDRDEYLQRKSDLAS